MHSLLHPVFIGEGHEVTEGSLNAEFKHRNLFLSTGRREPPPPTMSFSKNLELRITHYAFTQSNTPYPTQELTENDAYKFYSPP